MNDLLQLSVALLIWIGTAYLTNYLQWKGRNLATKEDIQEITDTVEKVKDSFERQRAEDKTKVDGAVEARAALASRRRAAYADYYAKANEILFDYFRVSFGQDFLFGDGQQLVDHQARGRRLFTELAMLYNMVIVYSDRTDINMEAVALLEDSVALRDTHESLFVPIKSAMLEDYENGRASRKVDSPIATYRQAIDAPLSQMYGSMSNYGRLLRTNLTADATIPEFSKLRGPVSV